MAKEPSAVQKRMFAKMGLAMPDGSYYIRNGAIGASDLQNAIDAVGRGEPQDSHNAIRVHIMKRAKALGLSDEIPDDWQADGSLKHDALDKLADGFLEHFGITGMRWGQHLPGTEAVGGKGNPDGANGPSAKYLPAGGAGKAAFIQRGDHSGSNPGSSNGQPGQDDVKTPEQQANESVDFLKNLRDHVASQADAAQSEAAAHTPFGGQQDQSSEPSKSSAPPSSSSSAPASAKPKSGLTSQQAQAVHQATKKHLAVVSQLHNKAKAAQAAHKKNKAKLAKHPSKGHARQAIHAASKQHAAHMNHLKHIAQIAHKQHQAHVAKLKAKSKHTLAPSAKAKGGHLTAEDQKALKQLSPAQRSALKKVPANLRAHAGNLTLKQMNNLRLTPNERTALSHLSPKQKAALAKATAASAKKRHEAALARKVGIAGNKSVEAAKKATATAQAHRTAAQKAAYNKLRLNAQNGTGHAMDDPEGTFLEHHGVKGMHWGVRHQRALELHTRVAEGRGSKLDKVKAFNEMSAIDLAKHKGNVTAYSKERAHNLQAMKDRVTSGNGTAADRVNLLLSKTAGDVVRDVRGKTPKEKEPAYRHDGLDDEVGEFLMHFGVKGMKWGVRRNGGHPGRIEDAHPVSSDAQKAHEIARKIHEHGTAALSNDDLQHLVTRQQLLQKHAQLNPADPSHYRKGLEFVKSLTNDVNTVVNAVNTGQRAVKTVQGLSSERPASQPRRQSRRTRNKPLKVVDIRAA